ncbi:Nif3-like dinuclear metal center hexameric protein [Mesobacillus harenae]|uniref:Nif3-like dinuclear metal center hexameric protein n=1 Tax=Mesobacillus harenae TaxID=2213203 RepID=UPI00157FFF79
MKSVNGHQVIQLFETFSPKALAVEGDKIGLQIGALNGPVQKVMIALDVVEEVVDEAIEKGAQLIIAHHPPIFRPLKKIDTASPSGQIIKKLIKHDIAVYAAHTNLDVAKGGVNDLLADAIGLKNQQVLVPTYKETLKKLVVFVPEENAAEVREALGKAGAGSIGDYSHCSFSSEGAGRFLPGEGTNPHIGKQGSLETVKETKIETIYPASIERQVINAMIKAHPYEEAAYDLYKLENSGEELGLGKIGYIEEMSLKDFCDHIKKTLEVERVRVVGDINTKIRKVAVLGGDGNKYFSQAAFQGADVYVTGDIYYHTAHDAMMLGLNMVDPGHNVEKIMKKGVAQVLGSMCKDKHYDVEVFPSELNTDPFQFI